MSQNISKPTKPQMADNSQRVPVLEPLLLILKSRKGVAFVVSVILLLLPAFTPVTHDMAFQMAVTAWVYIGGQSMVDAQSAAKLSREELREHIRKSVGDYLDEPRKRD